MELIRYVTVGYVLGIFVAFVFVFSYHLICKNTEPDEALPDKTIDLNKIKNNSGFFYLNKINDHTGFCTCVEIEYFHKENKYTFTKYFLQKGRAQVYGIDFFEQGNEAINEEFITVNHNRETYREIWSTVRNDDGKLISLKDKSNGVIYQRNTESNAIE